MFLRVSVIFRRKILLQVRMRENLSVYDLKAYIAKAISIPPEDQTLTYNGVVLENSHPLGKYNFPSDVRITLDVPLRYSCKYKIFVTTSYRSRPLKVRVRMEATLSELKNILKHHQQGPLDEQMIVYEARVFDCQDEGLTLAALGVRANAQVELVQRKRKYGQHSESKDAKPRYNTSGFSILSPHSNTESEPEVEVGSYRVQ